MNKNSTNIIGVASEQQQELLKENQEHTFIIKGRYMPNDMTKYNCFGKVKTERNKRREYKRKFGKQK